MPKSWNDAKFGNEQRVRINELIVIADYTKNIKFRQYRFIGDLFPYAQQWLPIYKEGKPLIGKSGKPVRIPFNITNFDPETGEYDSTKKCPFVEAAEKMAEYLPDGDEKKQLRPSSGFYALAISRKLQENPDKDGKPSKTERSTGFKDSIDSDSFTPVEVHQLNFTIGQGLESARELNKHKDKKTGERTERSIADPKYGCDVMIKFDPKGQGQGKYKVQKADHSPFTEEEQKYLTWDIVSAIKETTLSRKEAKIEADRILAEFMKGHKKKKKNDDDSPDVDDVPDDIEESLERKNKSKKKKDDDSPSPDLDSPTDDDDSPSPVKSKSSKNKKKKEESPDDDDSPSPVKSKSSSKKKKEESPAEDDSPSPVKKKDKKKKPSVDEEDSPVVSKKNKNKKKADSPDDQDEDEDEIDLDLDDED